MTPWSAFSALCLTVALFLTACASDPDPVLLESAALEADGDDTDAGIDTDEAEVLGVESDSQSERPAFTVVANAVSASVTAYTEPNESSTVIDSFSHPTPVGSPLVFRAVDGGAAGEWINVHLPVQPNGTTGWVRRADVTLSNNPFRIEVDRASYALRVYNQNSLWLETEIAVGNGATPTPVGDFYLLELLAPSDPTGPYGPYAFGLSGFSEVLESFGGADSAIIGLHGTNDPAALGTDVSHGCIRIENSIIEKLATSVPLGTPVLIT